MDLEQRFHLIADFLKKHHDLINIEVLDYYPKPLSPLLEAGLEAIKNYSDQELANLENNLQFTETTISQWHQLSSEIHHLIQLPQAPLAKFKLQGSILRKMNAKKVHEIERITSYLADKKLTKVIDIGSGAGHLSSALLSHHYASSANCVDGNRDYQEIGIRKIQNYLPMLKDKLTFTHKWIESEKDLALMLTKDVFGLGLHSCGGLSVHLLKSLVNAGSAGLNFGCCYHSLENNYNLSLAAKKQAIVLNKFSLTLATRSYAFVSEADLAIRKKVKAYRYTLHFLLKDHFNINFTALGSSPVVDYQSSFATYALKQLDSLKISHEFSATELENIYHSYQSTFESYYLAGFIRGIFGRVVELYLLLDRALYLQENHYKVEVMEFFERSISPRNVGLYFKRLE
jgi:hypothetical protein